MSFIPAAICPGDRRFVPRTVSSQTRPELECDRFHHRSKSSSKAPHLGAVGGEYYVLHYERGGIAHTYHILVATLVKSDTKPKLFGALFGGPFKDYAAFVDALRTGKLDDRWITSRAER